MDHARYSVTQVTMVARDANGSLPHFSQSLYRGTVVLGSGVGVLVKDAADPSQPLRVWAQDPEFPVGLARSLGLSGRPSTVHGAYLGRAWAQDSPGLCPGPQLSHHLSSHQQDLLPDGWGGHEDGHPTGAGGSLLC